MLRLLILLPIAALRLFIFFSVAMFRLLLLPINMLRLLLLLPIALVLSACASHPSQTASNKKPMFDKGWEVSSYSSGTVGTGR
jgi:hypothetical protein